jgi:hypothetical protein
MLAYAMSLRVGFLADDFLLLDLARRPGFDLQALLPGSGWFFYRPIGVMLTWELGWELFGANPLPYHVFQWVLHGATALAVGLWLAQATGRRGLGWLGGMLFGLFPLHSEAAGWVAAQWDVMSTLFGVLCLICFTAWWKGGASNPRLYVIGALLYGAAVFTKESLVTFAVIPGIAMWAVSPPNTRRQWRTLILSLVPLGAFSLLNVGLRIALTGSLGGYDQARYDYPNFIWDYLNAYVRRLLAPINPAMLGEPAVQIVGLLSSVALLAGLIWFGRAQRRLLLLALAWVLVTLAPVISLPGPFAEDLRDNRLLYLPSVGYCIGIAVLLYAAVGGARRYRPIAVGATACLLVLSGVVAWIQTMPLAMATQQAQGLVSQMFRMVPVEPRPDGMVWYLQDIPRTYRGAYMVHWGIGLARTFAETNDGHPNVVRVEDATQVPLAENKADAYAMRFHYDEAKDLWGIDYGVGITKDEAPPGPDTSGQNLKVWDFSKCSADDTGAWEVANGRSTCEPGRGMVVEPEGPDPQLIAPDLDISPVPDSTRFARIRAAVRYDGSEPQGSGPFFQNWFWRDPGNDFAGERMSTIPLKADGDTHVYWSFIPVEQLGDAITGLRFDPVNAPTNSEIKWIAVDLVD